MPEIVSVAYWTELHTPPQAREAKGLRALFEALADRCGYTSFKAIAPAGAMMAADEPATGSEPESYVAVMPDRIAVRERRPGGVSLEQFQERVEQAVQGSSKAFEIPFFWLQRACVQVLLPQRRHPSAMQYVAEDLCALDAGRLAGHLGPLRMVGMRCIAGQGEADSKLATPSYDVQIESSLASQSATYVWISATGSFPGPLPCAEPGSVSGNVRAVYDFVEGRVVPYVLGNPPPGSQ